MEYLKTIKDRWVSKTPDFFKGVKRLALTLGTSAASVWMINEAMSLGLHDIVLSVCKYLIAFAAAMGLTAQLTKDNQTTNP